MSAAVSAGDRGELAARLALLAAPGLPGWRIMELVRKYGSGRSVVAMLARECGTEVASGARGAAVRRRVVRALHTLATEEIRTLHFDQPGYPQLLHDRLGPDAPPMLFARGELSMLEAPAIGVVGCRAASAYGLDTAEQIGGAVARAGGCVISGLARGIDAAAHTSALDAGGHTIAVLGCGIDVYYPQCNMALQDRLARDGLLLSEFLPGEPPRKYQFPHRNRVIAGLSRAVVVVEAGEKSGALSTAHHAMAFGLQVFTVSNAVDRPTYQGILALHREAGCHVYTGVRDLLESTGVLALGAPIPVAPAGDSPPAGTLHALVWSALADGPAHVDAVAAAAQVPAADALVALLELELDGRARQLPGGRFDVQRAARRGATAARQQGITRS
jgi:DNA processing protein